MRNEAPAKQACRGFVGQKSTQTERFLRLKAERCPEAPRRAFLSRRIIDRPNPNQKKKTYRAEHGLHQPEYRGRHEHLHAGDRSPRAGLHLRRKGQGREQRQEEDVRRRGEDPGAEGEAGGPVGEVGDRVEAGPGFPKDVAARDFYHRGGGGGWGVVEEEEAGGGEREEDLRRRRSSAGR